MAELRWIIVSLGGPRRVRRLSRGRRELEPAEAIATIGIPWPLVEQQIEAAGYRVVPVAPSAVRGTD